MYEEIEIVIYDALISISSNVNHYFQKIITNFQEKFCNEIHTKIFSEKLIFNI